MKKVIINTLLLSYLFLCNSFSYGQNLETDNGKFWQLEVNKAKVSPDKIRVSKASKYSQFTLDITSLNQLVHTGKTQLVNIPLPNGNYVEFQLFPSIVIPPELASKYSSIHTFDGFQIGNPQNKGKFDLTPHGFHGAFSYNGKKVYVDPMYKGDNTTYQSYFIQDAQLLDGSTANKRSPPLYRTSTGKNKQSTAAKSNLQSAELGNTHIYRLAIATTGEYSDFHGGTKELVLASLVTLVNRVNEVYQQEVGVKLELAAQNDAIIFLDVDTDPYVNTDEDLDVNFDTINNAIGVDSYDIGHILGTDGGGLAGLGVLCDPLYKADGVSGSDVPESDVFFIGLVAHELGHQFGADHTFNSVSDSCSGNRAVFSAYEVGSASTIMGYAGLCGEEDLQYDTDPFFHIHSIDEIRSHINSKDINDSCGTIIAKTNYAPAVDAGADYTIPARTPFTLTGQATDIESDTLTYSWEQFDLGRASSSRLEAQTDDGRRPLFRNFVPQSISNRTFPKLSDLVSNQNTFGESLPTTNRDLNFRLVVRDTEGNLADDATKITVIENSEGFHIMEPSDNASWLSEEQTVTWHTANSELAPINCSTVDILLSNDSAASFDWILATETANDGSEVVNLPKMSTSNGRVKIACSNNIFFALNTSDINITSEGSSFDIKPEFTDQAALMMEEDQSLQLKISDFSFANDLQVDNLTISAGDNYTVSENTITPASNFHGNLTVAITATQGGLPSDVFIANVTVTSVNDRPISNDDAATVEQDSTNNIIDVIANDSDIDDDTITLSAIDYSGTGSASISDNQVSYSPLAGFSGSETLTYTINDGNQGSSNASLTITVQAKPVENNSGSNNNSNSTSSGGGSIGWLLAFLLVAFAVSKFSLQTTSNTYE